MVEFPDCPMKGSITMDRTILFVFGWPAEDAVLVFHRSALKRFVGLANELLSADLPGNVAVELPSLVSAPT